VAEALRVAHGLVILEQAWRPGREATSWELRRLVDDRSIESSSATSRLTSSRKNSTA
jgi:hypothetical protein